MRAVRAGEATLRGRMLTVVVIVAIGRGEYPHACLRAYGCTGAWVLADCCSLQKAKLAQDSVHLQQRRRVVPGPWHLAELAGPKLSEG